MVVRRSIQHAKLALVGAMLSPNFLSYLSEG